MIFSRMMMHDKLSEVYPEEDVAKKRDRLEDIVQNGSR